MTNDFIIASVLVMGCLIVGCGESKVAQCNKFNRIINQADAVTKDAKTGKPSALIRSAIELDRVAEELKAIAVEDRKLQRLRSRYVNMYGDIGKSFRKMAVSIQNQEPLGVTTALISLKQARKKDIALVKEINSYCKLN